MTVVVKARMFSGSSVGIAILKSAHPRMPSGVKRNSACSNAGRLVGECGRARRSRQCGHRRCSPSLTITAWLTPSASARPLTELQLFHSQRVVPHHTALTLGALGDCVSGAYRKRRALSVIGCRRARIPVSERGPRPPSALKAHSSAWQRVTKLDCHQ
jgi:hypothetical protein